MARLGLRSILNSLLLGSAAGILLCVSVAHAQVTPSCASGETLTTLDGGAWTCSLPDGNGGEFVTQYNADGTQAGANAVTAGGGVQQQAATGAPAPRQPVACQDPGVSGYFSCAIVRVIIGLISGMTALFASILQMATNAFSYAVLHTIVQFNAWFDTISVQVADAWTMFRDLANIAIIGIFVFIAISIILGLQEFGQKKLIARVIIVATLINFSFLFTLMIINTSNLFASVVYEALPLSQNADGSLSVGDSFTKYMGVYSWKDASDTLMEKYNAENQGFGAMLIYATFAAIFTLSAAGVFLYAAFLLFARAILLGIILLPLAALAFASYLSPALEETGWKRWWHSILQQSFMAPIMMVFVLISLKIAKAVSEHSAVNLASAASAPGASATWDGIFPFIVIVGTLFAGIYISSQLAGTAARRFALAGSATVAAAGLRGAGIVGRWGIGGTGIRVAERINAAQQKRREEGREVSRLRGGLENVLKGVGNAASRRSFDALSSKGLNKALAGAGGLTFGDTKVGAKGYRGAIEERKKKAVENADQEGHPRAAQVREEAARGFDKRQEKAPGAATQQVQKAEEEKKRSDAVHTELTRAAAANEKSKQEAETKLEALKNTRAQRTAAYDAERQRIDNAKREAQSRTGMAQDFAMAEVKKDEERLQKSKAELDAISADLDATEKEASQLGLESDRIGAETKYAKGSVELANLNVEEARSAYNTERDKFVNRAVERESLEGNARLRARISGFGPLGTGDRAAEKIDDSFVNKVKGAKGLQEAVKHLTHEIHEADGHGDAHHGGGDHGGGHH